MARTDGYVISRREEGQEMDWKRLIQFALSGSGDLEQYAILLVRVSIGLFFAISGQTNYLSPAAPNLFTKRWFRPTC